MLPYVKEIVNDFTKQTGDTKTAVTPAADHLFKIDQDAKPLSEEMGKVFHNFTAKCLFLTKRARPDISTAVAFCTTRVRKPDEDDWKKLQRMIRYLRGSLELPLMVGRRVTWRALRYARPYWRHGLSRKGGSHADLNKTEDQYKKLNRNGIGWSRRHDATNHVDELLYESARLPPHTDHPLSRQHECYPVGEEWQDFERQAHQAC